MDDKRWFDILLACLDLCVLKLDPATIEHCGWVNERQKRGWERALARLPAFVSTI